SLKLWRAMGLRQGLGWHFLRLSVRLGRREPAFWHFKPRQALYVLTVRLGGSSDMSVAGQIFGKEEYECLKDLRNVSIIIDLGANVGYSSAYLLSCFPGSRVLAVEPDESNFEVCKKNLSPYGDRAILLHGAAWSYCTDLALARGTFHDGREWASQVQEF